MKLEDLLQKPNLSAKREPEVYLRAERKITEEFIEKEEVPERDIEAEFRSVLDKAVHSVKGLQKIIEQIPDKSTVIADTATKAAMKRTLGVESDVVTFEIYQAAIRAREEIYTTMREAMSNEQFK